MTTSWAMNRTRERVERLCRSGLEDHELRSGLLSEIGKVVGFDWYAWPLADPQTTVGIAPMARIPCPEELPQLIRLKYQARPNRWTELLRNGVVAAALAQATGGELSRSVLWERLLQRFGVVDVLSVVLADRFGCWAWLDLWRGGGAPVFAPPETDFLAAVAPVVAAGLRDCRARDFHRGPGPAAPLPAQAVLTLDEDMAVVAQTSSAAAWLELLQQGPPPHDHVPAEVLNVAAQLLAREARVDDCAAAARLPIGGGSWASLSAARMDPVTARGTPPLAVTIQRCLPESRLAVFVRSFGLSRQERRLLELGARGIDTAELARQLGITAYTVQDQFKSMFAKCGIRSRSSLLALALGGYEADSP
ncbi:MAG TPA: LuxR C-terminal-related transcriptional regulator [Micrococcaceae bacterium]|jgi:DNA-binding CsgD family transcriptional regulator|nr:LuxR C-terminal-related transcriptional regulator [Micrococcaceae bacterium]